LDSSSVFSSGSFDIIRDSRRWLIIAGQENKAFAAQIHYIISRGVCVSPWFERLVTAVTRNKERPSVHLIMLSHQHNSVNVKKTKRYTTFFGRDRRYIVRSEFIDNYKSLKRSMFLCPVLSVNGTLTLHTFALNC
jgi:hypothetical protein